MSLRSCNRGFLIRHARCECWSLARAGHPERYCVLPTDTRGDRAGGLGVSGILRAGELTGRRRQGKPMAQTCLSQRKPSRCGSYAPWPWLLRPRTCPRISSRNCSRVRGCESHCAVGGPCRRNLADRGSRGDSRGSGREDCGSHRGLAHHDGRIADATHRGLVAEGAAAGTLVAAWLRRGLGSNSRGWWRYRPR